MKEKALWPKTSKQFESPKTSPSLVVENLRSICVPTATHAIFPEANGLGDPPPEALVKTVSVSRHLACGGPTFAIDSQRPWKQLLLTPCSCTALDPGPDQARCIHKHICLSFCISDTIFAKKLWCCERGEGHPSWKERLLFTSALPPASLSPSLGVQGKLGKNLGFI